MSGERGGGDVGGVEVNVGGVEVWGRGKVCGGRDGDEFRRGVGGVVSVWVRGVEVCGKESGVWEGVEVCGRGGG